MLSGGSFMLRGCPVPHLSRGPPACLRTVRRSFGCICHSIQLHLPLHPVASAIPNTLERRKLTSPHPAHPPLTRRAPRLLHRRRRGRGRRGSRHLSQNEDKTAERTAFERTTFPLIGFLSSLSLPCFHPSRFPAFIPLVALLSSLPFALTLSPFTLSLPSPPPYPLTTSPTSPSIHTNPSPPTLPHPPSPFPTQTNPPSLPLTPTFPFSPHPPTPSPPSLPYLHQLNSPTPSSPPPSTPSRTGRASS